MFYNGLRLDFKRADFTYHEVYQRDVSFGFGDRIAHFQNQRAVLVRDMDNMLTSAPRSSVLNVENLNIMIISAPQKSIY